ncbi:MAG: hypothetical protein WBB31_13500 [Saprospiraceae bacterium]
MNVRIISLLLLSLTALTMHAQIGAKVNQKSKIYGVWHNSQDGYQMSLILNEDGTGEFDGETLTGGTSSQADDQGTWYVQGDRLYVHSRTIGDASYKLEKRNHPKNVNDPMIVLDGRTFVTAYNKPPWR